MTRAYIEAMQKKEKEKVVASTFGLDLKPPNPVEIIIKPYPTGYTVPIPKVQWNEGEKAKAYDAFLNSMGTYCNY